MPATTRGPSWTQILCGLILYVALASLTGLGVAMSLAGPGIVWSVWSASAWGSFVFSVGAALVGAGAFFLARHYSALASILLAFVAMWCVYAWSWSITGPAMDRDGVGDPWGFVFQWGWLGLLVSSMTPAAAATAIKLRETGGATRRPTPWRFLARP